MSIHNLPNLKSICDNIPNLIERSPEYLGFVRSLPSALQRIDKDMDLQYLMVGYVHRASKAQPVKMNYKNMLAETVDDYDSFYETLSNQKHGQCPINDTVYDLVAGNVNLREVFMVVYLLDALNITPYELMKLVKSWGLDHLMDEYARVYCSC